MVVMVVVVGDENNFTLLKVFGKAVEYMNLNTRAIYDYHANNICLNLYL